MLPLLIATLLPLAESEVRLWFAVPLIVAVSLVYAATRHEEAGPLLVQAARGAIWMCVLLAVIAAIMQYFTMRI